MKQITITSDELPMIGSSAKECINLGQWLLFRTHQLMGTLGAAYFLKTGSSVFALDDAGAVVAECPKAFPMPQIDEIFYFADVDKPRSLSNMRALRAA